MLVFHYVQREYIFDSNGDFDTNANLVRLEAQFRAAPAPLCCA